MSCRYKLLLVVVMMIILVADYSLAAWRDTPALPVPDHTQEVKKETRGIAGAEFEFTYYTSTQDAGTLKDFYRSRLTNLGWKESTPLKDLEQIPGLQVETSLSSAWEQNLMFEKNGSMLIINFMPEGFSRDGKTRFTVSQGKLDIKAELPEDTDFTPKLLTQPQKDVAPTYPGAALISLSEPPHGLRATYFTKDDINSVAAFYKAQMPNYGWSLVEEQAAEKIDVSEGDSDELAKLCPSCAEKSAISAQNIETWMAQLSFSNQRGDTCSVVLSRVAPVEEMPGTFAINTILVNYAEKKE